MFDANDANDGNRRGIVGARALHDDDLHVLAVMRG